MFFSFLRANHVMKDHVIKHFPRTGDGALCPLIKRMDQRRLRPDYILKGKRFRGGNLGGE